ncbi:MAG TPA: peptidylprolyl isomerase, partial [Mycobacteriales bacterium]|nr:peptidylprolyl isomerase [Mycobacteriales bacterium]
MTTNKQRRQAAQRHLQRQLERRTELARKRRRNLGILATALAVLVVVGAALLITGVFKGDDNASAAADPSTSSSAPATSAAAPVRNADGTASCTYAPDDSGNPNLTDVGTPPTPEATPTQGTSTLLMSTNQGDLTLTLDRTKAPCAAASFTYLAAQKFFDGSS